jgi:hypothetical protein
MDLGKELFNAPTETACYGKAPRMGKRDNGTNGIYGI